MDPLEFRRKHLADNAKRLRQFDMGAKAIEWDKKWQKMPGAQAGPLKRGVGMAIHTWGGAARLRRRSQCAFTLMAVLKR
jgi:CO/xanthine dehydrogenase Mo-binding subunit